MLQPYTHSDKTVTVKPIETWAYGHRFRSRLEARYAVFLTELGVAWQYEPEGFDLNAGYYLPDFYLPFVNGGTWIEVKPHGCGSHFGWGENATIGIDRLHDPRLDEFSEYTKEQYQWFFVAYGIPSDQLMDGWAEYSAEGMLETPWDPFMWCVCGCGQTVGIEFDGRGDRILCHHAGCMKSGHGDKGYSHNHDRIRRAAYAARSARFEHGETP